jgi:hypothetical protein
MLPEHSIEHDGYLTVLANTVLEGFPGAAPIPGSVPRLPSWLCLTFFPYGQKIETW